MERLSGQAEIEVERLAKTYPGGTEAVRGISFAVTAGDEWVARVVDSLGPLTQRQRDALGRLLRKPARP